MSPLFRIFSMLPLLLAPLVLVDAKVKGASQLREQLVNLGDKLSSVAAASGRTTASTSSTSSVLSSGRRRIHAGRRKLMSSGKGEEEEEEGGSIGALLDEISVGGDTGSGKGKGKGGEEEEEEEEEPDEDEICAEFADAPLELTIQGNDFLSCEQDAVADFLIDKPDSTLATLLETLGLPFIGEYADDVTAEEEFLQGTSELIGEFDFALNQFFTFVEEETDDGGCELEEQFGDLAVAVGELLLLQNIATEEQFSCAPVAVTPDDGDRR